MYKTTLTTNRQNSSLMAKEIAMEQTPELHLESKNSYPYISDIRHCMNVEENIFVSTYHTALFDHTRPHST